ncbi:MAG: tail fiber domain-containing protein [Chthonomonadaceae bacterium]|nr:tail fiber domain-containing protein [Chthonomonadaceae bacterium]
MKILFLKSVVLTAFSTGMAALTFAQSAPAGLTFQGRLTTLSGQPVPNGNAKVRVRIFDAPTAGTRLWTSGEGAGQELSVPVRNGVFSTILSAGFNSSNNPLTIGPTVFQGGVIYVEIQPLNQNPIVPRTQIWSAPWSFWAETVSDGAVTTPKIADSAVTTAKLSLDSVASTNLVADRNSLSKVTDGTLYVNSEGNLVTPPGYRLGLGIVGDPISRLQVEGNTRITGDFFLTGNCDVTGNVHTSSSFTAGPNSQSELTTVSPGGIEFYFDGQGHSHYPGIYFRDPRSGNSPTAFIIGDGPGVIDFYSLFGPQGWSRVRAGSFEVQSTRRSKRDIKPIVGGLDIISQLRPVTYLGAKQKTNDRMVGLIAEEVAPVARPVVGFESDGRTPSGIDYSRLTPYLIKAVQEQQSEIQNLRSANEGLSKLNRSLVDRMERIERQLAKLNKH